MREAGGRFVEDQDARLSQQGTRNLDELLLRARKLARQAIDIEVRGKPRQCLCRCRAAALAVDEAEPAAPLGSQKQIFPDRQVRHEAGVLMGNDDAVVARRPR